MASPIQDPSSLPGSTVFDQEQEKVGEIKEIYGLGDDNVPMWVTIEMQTSLTDSRTVVVPMARLKEEDEQIRVPYSAMHLQDSPEVELEDEISEEDDRTLRDYYAIDHSDAELRSDNRSYADQVPEGEGQAQKLDEGDIPDSPQSEAPKTERAEEDEEGEESESEEDEDSGSKGQDDEDTDSESKDDTESKSEDDTESKSKDDTESEQSSDSDSKSKESSDSDSESEEGSESKSESSG